jgi:hypothetical protein
MAGRDLQVLRASVEEQQRHLDYLARLEKTGRAGCIWTRHIEAGG